MEATALPGALSKYSLKPARIRSWNARSRSSKWVLSPPRSDTRSRAAAGSISNKSVRSGCGINFVCIQNSSSSNGSCCATTWYAYVAARYRSHMTTFPSASAGAMTFSTWSARSATKNPNRVRPFASFASAEKMSSRIFWPNTEPPGSRVKTNSRSGNRVGR